MADAEALIEGVTRDHARTLLEPYRGERGKLKADLGQYGVALLWLQSEGSPTSGAEFLGYKHGVSQVSRWFAAVGLDTVKRNWADPKSGGGWMPQTETDAIRERYLADTGTVATAHCVEWQVPRGEEFARLIAVADLHYGSPEMDYQRWLKMRDWIAGEKHVRWAFHGDLFDLATTQSPGRSLMGQALSLEDARRLAHEDIAPIADKCVFMLSGNHDLRVARALQVNFDPVADLCRALDIAHLGYCGFVRYTIRSRKHEQQYTGYHHHGCGSGQTWGSFFNTLQRLADRNEADFVVIGHRHQEAALTSVKAAVDADGRLAYRKTQLVGAGSYMKHGGYAAEHGLAPAVLGSATVHMYTADHSIHARA